MKILEVKNLTKKFYHKDNSFFAINDVSFFINQGETIGLIGQSGCGKSTLAKIIMNLKDKSHVTILFKGEQNLTKKNIRKDKQMIFQDNLFSLKHIIKIKKIL